MCRDTDKEHVLRPYLATGLVEWFIATLRCTAQGPLKTCCNAVFQDGVSECGFVIVVMKERVK
jgi:hypothetical protein